MWLIIDILKSYKACGPLHLHVVLVIKVERDAPRSASYLIIFPLPCNML